MKSYYAAAAFLSLIAYGGISHAQPASMLQLAYLYTNTYPVVPSREFISPAPPIEEPQRYVLGIDLSPQDNASETNDLNHKYGLISVRNSKQLQPADTAFEDQTGDVHSYFEDPVDFSALDTNLDHRLDKNDENFSRISLTRVLINGEKQTLTLQEAGIKIIHFEGPGRFSVERDDGTQVDIRTLPVRDLNYRQ